MGTSDGREHMLKRHEIVVRIIDVNSRALRMENEINGLDIELRTAEREAGEGSDGRSGDAVKISMKIAELETQRQKLVLEKQWLEQALDELDGMSTDGPGTRRTS
jgi:hypothetical protein